MLQCILLFAHTLVHFVVFLDFFKKYKIKMILFFEKCLEIIKFIGTVIYLYIEWFVLLIIPKKPKSLKGEIILITGSANGIGKETCKKLAPLGATLVLWDIDSKQNEATANELKNLGAIKVFTDTVDMSKRSEIVVAANRLRQNVGNVSILYNNAGIASASPFLKLDPDKIKKIFDINILAHFWTLQEFLPDMLARNKGHVVTMCSLMAYILSRGSLPYFASKSAVHAFIECLKSELYFYNKNCSIKFTTIYPSFTKTNMTVGKQSEFNITMKYPLLVPFMEVDYVAQKIVEGILYEKEYIFLPSLFRTFIAVYVLMPRKIQSAFNNLFASLEYADPNSSNVDDNSDKTDKHSKVKNSPLGFLLAEE